MVIRGIPASAKTSADIREEEYDRKYDDKKKKKKGIQLSYFFTKNARRVLVDVVFLRLHRRRLYFRVVPFFPRLPYDEEWVPWLFLVFFSHRVF